MSTDDDPFMSAPVPLARRPGLSFSYLDPESILDSPDFRVVEAFLRKTKRTQLGWHYVVDLTWIYSLAKSWPRQWRILDAGGGSGAIQFLLAEMGFEVTNVDLHLVEPLEAVKRRYRTSFTRLPSYETTDYVNHLTSQFNRHSAARSLAHKLKRSGLWKAASSSWYSSTHDAWRQASGHAQAPIGRLDWCQANLRRMPEIPSASFEAVVSVSALEHVPFEDLPNVLAELRRVLKPVARYAITTSATEQPETWFHEPSRGQCFSRADLETVFGAADRNERTPQDILEKYRHSHYLRTNLASFYFRSGTNGMPWGEWDPKYVPVGIY